MVDSLDHQGPALGEGRRRTVERLDDLADPIEIGRWWGQVEQQDQADDLGRRQAEADQARSWPNSDAVGRPDQGGVMYASPWR